MRVLEESLRGVFGNTMTDLLTAVCTDRFLNGSSVALYRLMIAFHAVHDLPEAILDERYGGETSGVGIRRAGVTITFTL